MKGQFNIYSIITLLMLAVSVYLTIEIYHTSQVRRDYRIDRAELNDVKYGLLNAEAWKQRMIAIIHKKIEGFEIDADDEEQIKTYIEKALYELIDEIDDYLKTYKDQGNIFKKGLKNVVYKYAFDKEKFEKQVPQFAEDVLQEVNKQETKNYLKGYAQSEVQEIFFDSLAVDTLNALDTLKRKYNCPDVESCAELLNTKILKEQRSLWFMGGVNVFLVIAALLLWRVMPRKNHSRWQFHFLVLLCLSLLIGGVTTPMIDIDARISELSFSLMGEKMVFEDQVLFFRSKSILDVVHILVTSGEVQTILVGGLVFMFSIIFPASKLISTSVLLEKYERLKNNKFLRFFVYKSGKWSMADVMVVAIFMAFIGFKSIVDNQLSALEESNTYVDVITTDEYTSLEIGFMLFTAYVMAGLVLATFAKSYLESSQKENQN